MRGIPAIGIGLVVVVGIIALIITGAFWSAKHPSGDQPKDQPDDDNKS